MGDPVLPPEDGPGLLDENGELDEAEMRRCWNANRAELLAACPPGKRPHAFFRFDLGITDRIVWRWHDQLRVLLERGLISAEEAERCENRCPELNPAQAPEFCSSHDSRATIISSGAGRLGPEIVSELVEEFEVVSRWHTWRGRPELADRYRRRAEAVRQFLEDSSR
jgi:hypothetical protein